ncbi:hypothetical protein MANI_021371 [Metarhizium anisopliae]
MRFTSLTVLLVSLVASIHAGVAPREADGVLESREGDGIVHALIKTYKDKSCKELTEEYVMEIPRIMRHAVRLDTKGIIAITPCDVEVETTKGKVSIKAHDNECHPIEEGSEAEFVVVNCSSKT